MRSIVSGAATCGAPRCSCRDPGHAFWPDQLATTRGEGLAGWPDPGTARKPGRAPGRGTVLSRPFIDATRPENAGVLAFFRARNERRHPLCATPDEIPDPYLSLGSHPDVVERLWQALCPHSSWNVVVLGTPALVDPDVGTVLVVALGTSYWLRLTPGDLAIALAAGGTQTHRYGLDPQSFDASDTFGPTWVHGRWDEREQEWLLATSAADRVS